MLVVCSPKIRLLKQHTPISKICHRTACENFITNQYNFLYDQIIHSHKQVYCFWSNTVMRNCIFIKSGSERINWFLFCRFHSLVLYLMVLLSIEEFFHLLYEPQLLTLEGLNALSFLSTRGSILLLILTLIRDDGFGLHNYQRLLRNLCGNHFCKLKLISCI